MWTAQWPARLAPCYLVPTWGRAQRTHEFPRPGTSREVIVARIDLNGVSKTLQEASGVRGRAGATFAIRDVSLNVHDGQTMVVLGPSGCGKTTLLKLIAGLLAPEAGTVHYN